MKKCIGCGILKPLEDYQKDARLKDGRRARCKLCYSKRSKQLYSKQQNTLKVAKHRRKTPGARKKEYQIQALKLRLKREGVRNLILTPSILKAFDCLSKQGDYFLSRWENKERLRKITETRKKLEYQNYLTKVKNFPHRVVEPPGKSITQQFTKSDKPRINNGFLEVKCFKCKLHFFPTKQRVKNRKESYKTVGSYANFYCSDSCKSACSLTPNKPTKNQLTPYLLNLWAKDVKHRDGYTCYICDEKRKTLIEAHHILPKSTHPAFAYDLDNGIAVCKSCHRKKLHINECSSTALATKTCGT